MTALADTTGIRLSPREILDAALALASHGDRWPDVLHISDALAPERLELRVDQASAALGRVPPAIFIGRELLPGVDELRWNPRTDGALPRRFGDADLVSGKAASKLDVQRAFALPVRSTAPLLGAIGPFQHDLLADLIRAADHVPAFQLAIVIDADGDPHGNADKLAASHPARVRVRHERGTELRALQHRVIAASDFAVVTHRSPHGSGPLYPLRYGSLLIAPSVPAFATVTDLDPRTRTGSGFLYDPSGGPELTRAVQRAVTTQRGDLDGLRRRMMQLDLGWTSVASRYAERYRAAASLRPEIAENLSDT